ILTKNVITLCCVTMMLFLHFFFSSRRRHTISKRDWSSDVCSSDLSYSPMQSGYVYVASQKILFVLYGKTPLLHEFLSFVTHEFPLQTFQSMSQLTLMRTHMPRVGHVVMFVLKVVKELILNVHTHTFLQTDRCLHKCQLHLIIFCTHHRTQHLCNVFNYVYFIYYLILILI